MTMTMTTTMTLATAANLATRDVATFVPSPDVDRVCRRTTDQTYPAAGIVAAADHVRELIYLGEAARQQSGRDAVVGEELDLRVGVMLRVPNTGYIIFLSKFRAWGAESYPKAILM